MPVTGYIIQNPVLCSNRKTGFAGKLFFCLLFCSLQLPEIAKSQYPVIDQAAVKKQIEQTGIDSTRSRLCGILGWSLRFTDTKESQRLADEMIRLSTPKNDYLRLAEAYRIKGFAKVLAQDLSGTLDMYAIGEGYAKKANSGYMLASFKSLIAGMYQDKGDFDKAIGFYIEGLKIAESYKDPEMTATLANNLAEAYSDAGRPVGFTLPYYEKALKEETAMANWQYVGMICSNIAKEEMMAGNHSKAEKYAKLAIENIRKKNDRAYVYATVISDIGEVYSGLGKYPEAENYLLEGFRILDSIGTRDNKLIPLSALSKMYAKQGRRTEAVLYAKRLLDLAGAFHTKLFLRDGYKVLSDVEKQKGDAATALKYYEEYKRWNDSIYNESREKSIANAEGRIKLSQKELEVASESEKKTRENNELRQSNQGLQVRSIIAIGMAIVLLLTGIMLALVNRDKTRRNIELEAQKKIIEKQSAEKDTLIREINHRVKNNLQVISSLLNLQANSITDPTAIDALRETHKRVKAISLIHQKLYGFENIASIPLEEYIEALYKDIRMVHAAGHIQLVCRVNPKGFCLDIESAIPVGLILNEIITNALKYAFAGREKGTVVVEFTGRKDQQHYLIVHDDGIGLPDGFDPEKTESLGFRIVRELTRQLRGTLSYASEQGSVFQVNFPASERRNKPV